MGLWQRRDAPPRLRAAGRSEGGRRRGSRGRYARSPAMWRTAWRAKVMVRPQAQPTMYSG